MPIARRVIGSRSLLARGPQDHQPPQGEADHEADDDRDHADDRLGGILGQREHENRRYAVAVPAVEADERADPGHLIHIGYAKAGSTFLQDWFAAHPELAYAKGGFAGYSTVWDLARQAAVPSRRVAWRVTSSEALTAPSRRTGVGGHRNGDWVIAPEARRTVCSLLAQLFPDARILLVTRGFRSVYLSGYSQYVRMGGRGDFDPTGRNGLAEGLEGHWNYDELIRIYEAAFDGRVTVLPYELLQDDPARFVAALQSELGLTEPGPIPGRVNPSLPAGALRWYPRLTRLVESVPVRGRARDRLLNAWLRQTRDDRLAPLVRLLERVHPEPPIDTSQVADELLETMRGQAEALRGRALFTPYAAEYLL
jgi:hypothetical protein